MFIFQISREWTASSESMRSRIWRKKEKERAGEVHGRIWRDKQTCVNLSVWQKEWMNGRWARSGRGGQQMKWKIYVRVSSKGRLTRANPTGHHWSGDVLHYIWARTVAWMKGIMSEWSLGHYHACHYELWGLASLVPQPTYCWKSKSDGDPV